MKMYEYFPFTHSIVKNGWRTPDTYTNLFTEIPPIPGVYILTKLICDRSEEDFSESPAYIGMSTNLLRRLENHPIKQLFDFSSRRFFLPWPKEDIRNEERRLIGLYNPPFNIIGKMRG